MHFLRCCWPFIIRNNAITKNKVFKMCFPIHSVYIRIPYFISIVYNNNVRVLLYHLRVFHEVFFFFPLFGFVPV